MSEAQHGGERNDITRFPWPYRRIAAEEAFSLPEISDEDRRKIYRRNAERIFGIPDGDEPA